MIETKLPAEPFPTGHRADCLSAAREQQYITLAFMIRLVMMVGDLHFQREAKRTLSEGDELRQALVLR